MAINDTGTSNSEQPSIVPIDVGISHVTQLDPEAEVMRKINSFYSLNGREPALNRSNMLEYGLSVKLQDLRHHKFQLPELQALDEFKLLELKSSYPCEHRAKTNQTT